MGDLILDTIRQTVIKVVLEGTFSIAPDLRCDPIELDHVLGNTLTILHGQVVKLVLCISDRVVQTKVCLEFQDELLVVSIQNGWRLGLSMRRRSGLNHSRVTPLR